MPKSFQTKRDAWWLLGLTLLLLTPLYFLVRKQQTNAIRENGYSGSSFVISPDGAYVAALESPPRSTSPTSFSGLDLVVHSLSDEKEIVRMPVPIEAGKHLQWANDQSAIAVFGNGAQIFQWTGTAKPETQTVSVGTPQGTKTFSRPINTLQTLKTLGLNGTSADAVLSFENDVFLRRDTGGSFSAFQISTGNSIPLSSRAQQSSERTFWDSTSQFAIRPMAGTATENAPLQVVFVEQEPTPTPTPMPSPTPTATPKPLTVAQKTFLEKEKRENAEIEKLVTSVLGDDGTPPPPLSAKREAEIEVEVKKRNQALFEERNRLFPPAPTPTPRPIRTYWASVELVDLVSGQTFWKRRIPTTFRVPRPLWSPDGSRLALVGLPVRSQNQSKNPSDSAFALLDPATGKELHFCPVQGIDPGSSNNDNVRFLPTNGDFELLIPMGATEWHFFDAKTGKMSHQWDINFSKEKMSPYNWSTTEDGADWVFLASRDGQVHWKHYARNELEKILE